jgi:prepilin-type processing-associated H-X9-DG protein
MKTKLAVVILVFAILSLTAPHAHAIPLSDDLSGYYKLGYTDGNTYIVRVEMGIGAIKAYVLNDPNKLYLGIIVGDKIYFVNGFNQPSWGVLTQLDENTGLITSHNADTGETNEMTAVRISEEEANQVAEQFETAELHNKCMHNLKVIGLMLHLFEQDHGGELPYSFNELDPEYVTDKDIFVCPVRGGEFHGFEQDYEYIPGFRTDTPNPDEQVVVIERPRNHLGSVDSHHVLYLDGHVERITD